MKESKRINASLKLYLSNKSILSIDPGTAELTARTNNFSMSILHPPGNPSKV